MIPIVCEDSGGNNQRNKVEFDLFDLTDEKFGKLEHYVNLCIEENEKKDQQKLEENGQLPDTEQIQNQINEKLIENKMSIDTEILEN